VRDAVLLTAAAALVAADGVAEPVTPDSLTDRLRDALGRAADAVDRGAATAALERWVATSRSLAQRP
jgi:anthranilate phosphoribosyltransferase